MVYYEFPFGIRRFWFTYWFNSHFQCLDFSNKKC